MNNFPGTVYKVQGRAVIAIEFECETIADSGDLAILISQGQLEREISVEIDRASYQIKVTRFVLGQTEAKSLDNEIPTGEDDNE